MEKIRKLIDLPVEDVKKIRHLIADETSMSVKVWMESAISGAIKSKWDEKEKR